MTTINDDHHGTRARASTPVTPPGRALSVKSPPGAPRACRVSRRLANNRRRGSVCFSTSPRMGPAAFERLLRASVGVRAVSAGGGGVTATTNHNNNAGGIFGPPIGSAASPVSPAVTSPQTPSGFVLGLNILEDDPFGPVPVPASAGVSQSSTNVTGAAAAAPGGDVPGENRANRAMARIMGHVAAGIVVAAEAIGVVASSSSAGSSVGSPGHREI